MATVVAVMDRPSFRARTDNIVVACPERRSLLWVPRDLWCEEAGERINCAYARGGHDALLAALAEHGIAVEHSVALGREAVEAGLEGVTVTMPVREPLRFWYPLSPQLAIADGRKLIRFDPPVEELAGERIHQWIGAKFELHGRGGDLRRIERQQQLVAVLLGDGFDFSRFVAEGLPVRISRRAALEELASVEWRWSFEVMGGLTFVTIEGKEVLIPSPWPPR